MKRIGLILMAILLVAFPLFSKIVIIPETTFRNALIEEEANIKRDSSTINTDADTIFSITVTNVNDIVNGNTLNIDSLINNPGPDGISLREAIYASNGTLGLKTIGFHPSLTGDSITIIPGGDLLLMSSGELTINGDINGDGTPDITLDGHLGQEGPSKNGFCIASSDNKIEGLKFSDFVYAILITPTDMATKLFANNKIINNTILSERGAGIWISPCGVGPVEEIPIRSDIVWQGTVIQGNTAATKQDAFHISAAEGGGDRNKVLNTTISHNYVSSESSIALCLVVADVNSDYFGIPGPIDYSEYNLIDSVTITDNVIEDSFWGIGQGCANFGNSYNFLQNVKIIGNTITNIQGRGIDLIAGGSDGKEKACENNLIANVEITRNTISLVSQGILVMGGEQVSGIGAINNRVENVLIAENEIHDYVGSGVCLTGGESNSETVAGNILDSITISGNHIYQSVNQGSGVGLAIVGGSGSPLGSSLHNFVKGMYILNNQISENETGISLIGGNYAGAEGNQVILAEINGDKLVGNSFSLDIFNNINGAVNNVVTGTVSNPTFSPLPDTFTTAMNVHINCEIPGATIRFTMDKSIPTESSPIYTSPIHIDTTMTIKARAYLSNWIPSDLATAIFTVKMNTEVEEYYKSGLSIYPNPTNDLLIIETLNPEHHLIEITSLKGQLIFCTMMEGTLHRIDLISFPKGVYLITVSSPDSVTTRKIIKL